jgi:small GTP-binding protein
MEEEGEHRFKLVVAGDSEVGKTSLVSSFALGHFPAKVQSTISTEYTCKSVVVDGTPVRLMIWDTSGSDRHGTVTRNYFRNAAGIVLVFDINQARSFERAKELLSEIQDLAGPGCRYLLLANKADLKAEGPTSR